MFRPNSDKFRGIFGLPGQNQNESLHKTDCCKGPFTYDVRRPIIAKLGWSEIEMSKITCILLLLGTHCFNVRVFKDVKGSKYDKCVYVKKLCIVFFLSLKG